MTAAMTIIDSLRFEFNRSLKRIVLAECPADLPLLREMVSYHFGWDSPQQAPGKQLRPLFLLLSAGTLRGKPEVAMAPAAAIEVLHNYTLIHDDMEDMGERRHGRPSLWHKYGSAQALNTGDFLASASFSILSQVSAQITSKKLDKLQSAFQKAAVDVTLGQHLDMLSEGIQTISLAEYERMIDLKTARLFETAFSMGAVAAGATSETQTLFAHIGREVGMGFQVLDDFLGIWADPNRTGKSISTDLVTRKKTYPVLYGLDKHGQFYKLWNKLAEINEQDARSLARLLVIEGAAEVTKQKALDHKTSAVKRLESIDCDPAYRDELINLIERTFSPVESADI